MKLIAKTVIVLLVTLIDEAVVVLVLLWVLPHLGIKLPFGLKVGILVALAAWAALTYRPIKRVLEKEVPSPAGAMVGMRGTALTQLAPNGQVRIQGEVWQAVSSNGVVAPGEEISVLRIEGLRLTVRKEEQKT
jgi:membrane protein implicated in regulation of membrane protease activity